MEGNNTLDSLVVVVKIRLAKSTRFLKFLSVGSIGLIIQWSTLALLRTSLPPFLATALGGELAIISNFILNNIWTFREKIIKGRGLVFKFFQFNLSSFGGLLLQSTVVFLGNQLFGQSFYVDNIFFFLGLILVVIWNFFFYSRIIWKVR